MFLSDQEEGRKAAGNRESVLLLLTSFLRHAAKGFGPGSVGRTAQEKKIKSGDNCEADTWRRGDLNPLVIARFSNESTTFFLSSRSTGRWDSRSFVDVSQRSTCVHFCQSYEKKLTDGRSQGQIKWTRRRTWSGKLGFSRASARSSDGIWTRNNWTLVVMENIVQGFFNSYPCKLVLWYQRELSDLTWQKNWTETIN